ncbi:MAG: hypothetical protein H6918_03955 [Sphingomonadaceae bacterium]|nr:hypothetical protein [Sphingomonadaceae bacterium]
MERRLYSTCRLSDGIHWMLMRPDGTIYAFSDIGFASVGDALRDIGVFAGE